MTTNKKLTIYSKHCVPCLYANDLANLKSWATARGIKVVVKRTSLNPLWHNQASKYLDDYDTFIVYNEKVYDFASIVKVLNWKGAKNNDVQDVQSAKESTGTNRVAGKKSKAKSKAKKAKK